jgi:hypothetical protein
LSYPTTTRMTKILATRLSIWVRWARSRDREANSGPELQQGKTGTSLEQPERSSRADRWARGPKYTILSHHRIPLRRAIHSGRLLARDRKIWLSHLALQVDQDDRRRYLQRVGFGDLRQLLRCASTRDYRAGPRLGGVQYLSTKLMPIKGGQNVYRT